MNKINMEIITKVKWKDKEVPVADLLKELLEQNANRIDKAIELLEDETTYIMFKPSTKEIKFCGSFKNKVDIVNFSMNTKLLQAINKQVEELGWNK